jgi:hypothetical protein
MQPTVQSAVQESLARKVVHTLIGFGALALIGGAVLFILSLVGVIGYDRDGSAIGVARDAVRSRLVSPESAKFPFGSTKIAARTADGQFRIAFVVADSQNKFGAMLRSESLVLLWDRNGTMESVHTEVFEKSPTVRDVRKLTEEVGKDWAIEEWLR